MVSSVCEDDTFQDEEDGGGEKEEAEDLEGKTEEKLFEMDDDEVAGGESGGDADDREGLVDNMAQFSTDVAEGGGLVPNGLAHFGDKETLPNTFEVGSPIEGQVTTFQHDLDGKKKQKADAVHTVDIKEGDDVCDGEESDGSHDDEDDSEPKDYEVFQLRILREKNRTGFEPNQDWRPRAGALIGNRYKVEMAIGEAVFSRTYKCIDTTTEQAVCLKIIKNNKEYFDQGVDEIRILEYIGRNCKVDEKHLVRLLDAFYFREHLIIVTELLRDNLYEFSRLLLQRGVINYFNISRLKKITIEVLEALDTLHSLGLVHCDLKPENILIQNFSACTVKVIDFGSACFTTDELTSYVQSRSYRAPEVRCNPRTLVRYKDRSVVTRVCHRRDVHWRGSLPQRLGADSAGTDPRDNRSHSSVSAGRPRGPAEPVDRHGALHRGPPGQRRAGCKSPDASAGSGRAHEGPGVPGLPARAAADRPGASASIPRVAIGSGTQLATYTQAKTLVIAAGFEDGVQVHLGCELVALAGCELIGWRWMSWLTFLLCVGCSEHPDGPGGDDGDEPDGRGVDADLQPEGGERQGQALLGRGGLHHEDHEERGHPRLLQGLGGALHAARPAHHLHFPLLGGSQEARGRTRILMCLDRNQSPVGLWYPSARLVAVEFGRSRLLEVDLVAEQVADVVETVLNHRGALQRQTPGDDTHVLRQAHGAQHLRTEHTRVTDLSPLLQIGVEGEDLHAGLRVRVVRRLEAHLRDADLEEKGLDNTDEVAERQVVVGHHALHLVELGQVGRVHALVTEHTVNGEVLLRREAARLVRQLVQHLSRDSRGVRTQDVRHGRLALEGTAAVTAFVQSSEVVSPANIQQS
ncbi:hypothetical protein ON010_g1712 [Phytophthora cinnamomi]|nr:hypothetical protein ON010_g1712 [Phytophthora cinnamomi]